MLPDGVHRQCQLLSLNQYQLHAPCYIKVKEIKTQAVRTSPSSASIATLKTMISYLPRSALRTCILISNMWCQEFLHQLDGLGNLGVSNGKPYLRPWQLPQQMLKREDSTKAADALM